jgi:hypothetical protein
MRNPVLFLLASLLSGGLLLAPGLAGAGAVLVQPDGKIVVARFSGNNATGQVFIALARYNG